MTAAVRADSLVRALLGLADPDLRTAYVLELFRSNPASELGPGLDVLAGRAEQAEERAREVLVAIVDALNLPCSAGYAQELREEAAGASLLSLERLTRLPLDAAVRRGAGTVSSRQDTIPGKKKYERIPDYGAGRPLTLGERKALARRPDRRMLERLIADPHPDVIRRLLVNPRLTELDVLRLAARRPAHPEVLAEIVRAPRWIHRTRVRMAIMLNPDTPLGVAVPISGLLLRQELSLVIESTHVAAAVRAVCIERLARRPPSPLGSAGEA